VRLEDAETVWDKLGYTFVNVVEAGLVRDFIDWPGVRSTPKDWLGAPTIVKRPGVYFSDRDKRWAQVELRFTVPPHFRDRPVNQVVADMNAEIERRQRDIRAERRRKGQTFLGADRVLETSPFAYPRSPRCASARYLGPDRPFSRMSLRTSLRLIFSPASSNSRCMRRTPYTPSQAAWMARIMATSRSSRFGQVPGAGPPRPATSARTCLSSMRSAT
jgi:hypothetical protein